jgi:hypothetical protein
MSAETCATRSICHGEERSDEAISTHRMRDCFAALAMTFLWKLDNLV